MFQNARITPLSTRHRIADLWLAGNSHEIIAGRVGVTRQTVSNILRNLTERGHLLPLGPGGKERSVANPDVVEHIEYQKFAKPSTTVREIQAYALVKIFPPDQQLET